MNIKYWMKKYRVMKPEGDDGGSNGGGTGDGGTGGDGGAGGTGGDKGGGKADAQGAMGAASKEGDDAGAGGASKKDAPGSKGSEGGYWPDDWRATASKGDAKLEARFGRYASPEAALTALIAAQNRISSGELKPVLDKDATPDQVKAWRAEQGIPETPDKYDLDLGGGLVVGEEDKPLVAEFLKNAHATNQTPEQVKASLRAYYAVHDQLTQKQADADVLAQETSIETLRAEWGPEFKRNVTLIHNLLDRTTSKEIKDKFLGGRLADGTPIGSSPEALKMMLGLALADNPAGTLVPGGSGDMGQAVDDEIGKIEAAMKKNRAAYNKDEKMQARYRELLGAREKFNKRKVA